MKVLLINSCLRRDNPRKFFPVGLGFIATVIHNAGYDLTIYDLDAGRYTDDHFSAFLAKNRFDVVGLGTLVTHYRWIKWAISVIRETNPHAKIVVGSSVATSIPEILLERTEADVAVIGEGEVTVLELLERFLKNEPLEGLVGIYYKQKGEVISNPRRTPIKDLDALPFVNRELFDVEEYLNASQYNVNEPYPMPLEKIRIMNLSSTRGCVFACGFCYHNFLGTRYRWRSPDSIVTEIKELKDRYGVNYIQLWNDLGFSNKHQMEKFCDRMIEEKLDIHWFSTVLPTLFNRVDPHNDVVARKMKESGCVHVGFSLESAVPEILKAMHKPITLEGYMNTRWTLLRAKVGSLTSVVFGYPEETEETIRRTIDFCIKAKISPSAGFIQPMPKTPIYRYALENGNIKDEEEYLLQMGDRQDFHINLTRLSDHKLREVVESEVRRCQDVVLKRKVSTVNPLKTLRKRSNDEVNT